MNTNTFARVPAIRSEIAVALSFIRWPLKAFVEFCGLVGRPVTEKFLDDALDRPWREFRASADPILVENLKEVLASLGAHLEDNVFGIVRSLDTRISHTFGGDQATMLLALATHYPEAHIRVAFQIQDSLDASPAPAVLINTGDRFLLWDHGDIDCEALIDGLYANCLHRLTIGRSQIRVVHRIAPTEAVRRLTDHTEYITAQNLPKSRALELARQGA